MAPRVHSPRGECWPFPNLLFAETVLWSQPAFRPFAADANLAMIDFTVSGSSGPFAAGAVNLCVEVVLS